MYDGLRGRVFSDVPGADGKSSFSARVISKSFEKVCPSQWVRVCRSGGSVICPGHGSGRDREKRRSGWGLDLKFCRFFVGPNCRR